MTDTYEKSKFFVKGGNAPVEIRGTAKYAKLGALDQWGKYSCRIYPNQESMPKVHKLISEGVKNKMTKDDDGYSVTFSRPQKIKTRNKGEVLLDPIIVTNDHDQVLDQQFIPDGAEITMTLETYGGPSPSGYGMYKAARLKSIKIHD